MSAETIGDVVIAIEDRPVSGVSDFDRRIAWYDEKRVTLTIVRDRERRRVEEPEGARRRLVVDRQRAWRERRIREQIESLERRLESLRHQLERLDAERDPDPDG